MSKNFNIRLRRRALAAGGAPVRQRVAPTRSALAPRVPSSAHPPRQRFSMQNRAFPRVPCLTLARRARYDTRVFRSKTSIVVARTTVQAVTSQRVTRENDMADARRMGKSELFSHFADRFEVKRTQAREYFDELTQLAEKELKRSGEFVLPGMVKLVVQKRKARMGRNPATGEAIKIPAKTVVKARIAKQLKDAVLPRK
jgi:DNA-binding protein HU-beta